MNRWDRFRLRSWRWLRWGRRLLAAGLLVVALMLTMIDGEAARAPAGEPTAPAIVAGRDLPPGHVLSAADLAVQDWPVPLLPRGALSPGEEPLGRVLSAALAAGDPVTDLRLLGPGLYDTLDPGLRAVPVRLTDAGVSALLRPGDRIDLYAVDAGPGADGVDGQLVAADALVLGVPRSEDGVIGEGAIVVVAVSRSDAARLVGAAYSRSLAATLAPP